MTAPLFAPLDVGPLHLMNRIVVSPMCQYSADDGCMNDWHLQHLMTLAMSGAALVVVEASAVERSGRITHGCAGLYSDANERAMHRVLTAAREVAPAGTKFAVQLAHAGRKASTRKPWEPRGSLGAGEDPWPTVAPSALPFAPTWQTPEALSVDGIARIRESFVASARRATRIGFDAIEVHFAHGYLLHEFYSPLANRREDAFGGDRDRRLSFPLSVVGALRAALAPGVALGVRITGQDWMDRGLTVTDAVHAAQRLKEVGADYVCVSSGGIASGERIDVGPDYQVPFAARVRRETRVATRAVGMITKPEQANSIIERGDADLVALARSFLDDPRWVWHAAEALGEKAILPRQYERVAHGVWPPRAGARP
jgi:2,4-dienoyl-CoA reductase-like NADH-dependent reductase (Old Yellow Enzyme family)